MSHSEYSDDTMRDLLDAITNAMLDERDGDIEKQIRQSGMTHRDLDGTVALIERLRDTLVAQQPSEKFIRKLRQDLGGVDYDIASRLRYMPARVHIAAGLTLLAGGLMLITRRRNGDTTENVTGEIPALQQQ